MVVAASVLTTAPAAASCYGPGCSTPYYSSGPATYYTSGPAAAPGYVNSAPTYYNNGPTYYSSSPGYTTAGYDAPVPVYRTTYYARPGYGNGYGYNGYGYNGNGYGNGYGYSRPYYRPYRPYYGNGYGYNGYRSYYGNGYGYGYNGYYRPTYYSGGAFLQTNGYSDCGTVTYVPYGWTWVRGRDYRCY